MSIKCPYCSFVIELKGVHAGHFSPKCPKCGDKFGLVIHPDPKMQPTVTALAGKVNEGIADALGIKDTPMTAAPKPVAPKPAAKPVQSTHLGATSVPQQQLGATSIPQSTPVVQSQGIASQPQVSPEQITHIHPPTDIPASPDDMSAGTVLGGYELVQKLGQGGMGSVYLARQVSLDRNVALKILSPRLASDPQLVSRFTREAYAAAQLTHHNIVQIHDIGQDKGRNFFSMEFIPGQTLAGIVNDNGKVDVETGVSYILQAARGLKFAHEHGLIHRDVKPENLLLNDQGIVKVADLGLVKRIGSHETEQVNLPNPSSTEVGLTQYNKSMGTPLYMPPEQAMDAARVDQRADIYSLGCTLYHMIVGRPPFMGKTAMEVMTKHQHEPVIPPDVVVKDVPHALSPIVVKMLSKTPEARYQTMKDVIASLEDFLGIASAGPFVPKEEHVKILEFAVEKFNDSLWAKLRPKLIIAFYAFCALLAIFLWWYHSSSSPFLAYGLAGGMIGIAVLTTVIYQITLGITQKTVQFQKVRALLFGASIFDWLKWTLGVCVMGAGLYLFDLHWWWIGGGILALGIAQAFHWVVDLMISKDRNSYVIQAEQLIKKMRVRGLDENAIRQFVCKFSGKHWEEFFESLFGYDAKLQARNIWGKERGKDRPKFAAWRDPLVRYFDYRIQIRKEFKEAKLLAKLEEKALASKGLDTLHARKQAKKNAERLVDRASQMRVESARHVAETAIPPSSRETAANHVKATALPGKSRIEEIANSMLIESTGDGKDQQADPHYVKTSYFRRRYGSPLDMLFGPMLRFTVGMVLLAIFALWWNQNNKGRDIIAEVDVRATVNDPTKTVEKGATAIREFNKVMQHPASTDKPVHILFVPESLCKALSGSPSLIAGLLLTLSAFFRGRLMTIAIYASAYLAIFASHTAWPIIGPLNQTIAFGVAIALWIVAIIFLRQVREG